jgi:hypothetical protein
MEIKEFSESREIPGQKLSESLKEKELSDSEYKNILQEPRPGKILPPGIVARAE